MPFQWAKGNSLLASRQPSMKVFIKVPVTSAGSLAIPDREYHQVNKDRDLEEWNS